MKNLSVLAFCLFLAVTSCVTTPRTPLSGLDPEAFHAEVNGKQVSFYVLTNSRGMEVCLTNYGARVLSIMVPDRNGKMNNVVVGHESIDAYLEKPNSYGAVIGRYANRIAGASFTLDGVTYTLDKNSGENCLHGGSGGWCSQVYDVKQYNDSTLVLAMDSPDGEMGFPGNVHAEVTYKVTEDNALDISYTAVTDKPTVLNLTNHTFFNLSGSKDGDVGGHVLYVNADSYTPLRPDSIPTGEILPVEYAGIDFRQPRALAGMYDFNMILNEPGEVDLIAASLYAPENGIRMEVRTDQPGLQLYVKKTTVCLECQLFPDSPNNPSWPSSVLRPGETYRHRCIYSFSIAKDSL